MSTLTGYGPRARLIFDGDERKYELWEVRFLGHMRVQKMYDAISEKDDEKVDQTKNAEVFAELVQLLDDRSLSLVMRDALHDGRKALSILRTHYMPKGKPRVITLYTELTSLHKDENTSVTDYVLRAEGIAAALRDAGETISDGLLVAMVLKGLPIEYKTFTAVVTQRDADDALTFSDFKVLLRNYEDTEKVYESERESSVLRVSNANSGSRWSRNANGGGNYGYNAQRRDRDSRSYESDSGSAKFQGTCHSCGARGHKAFECRKSGRWCDHCQVSSHDTDFCRRNKSRYGGKTSSSKDHAKTVDHVEEETGAIGDASGVGSQNPSLPRDCAKVSEHPCQCTCTHQKSVQCSTRFMTGHTHSFAFKVVDDCHAHSCQSSCNSVLDDSHGLLVDCGATTHIVNDENKFFRFDENFDPAHHFIELADGSRTNNLALKKGDACVHLQDEDGNVHECVLHNALYIPSFVQNIFSVQSATERGAHVEFCKESASLLANGVKFQIKKCGKLYFLHSVSAVSQSQKTAKHTLQEWHEILGHCNKKDVSKLEQIVKGMTIVNRQDFECGVCLKGKMTQDFNRKPDKRATSPLHLVHFDLAGPIEPVAVEGFKYVLGCVDDFSGVVHLYFLKQKSDTVRATEKFLADVSPFADVKRIRSDQGGEFISEAFESLLIRNKIKHERSCPHSPHQNGTVERSWRSLFEMARCLLIQSGLPKSMWTYALMTAMYIRNRCHNPRTECTPFEMFTGSKPNIAHMQKFGCTCYALVQNPKKLDDRSVKGVFVGYDKGSPAYLVYFPESGIVRKVRCVKFTREPSVLQKPEPASSDDVSDFEDCVVRRFPVTQTETDVERTDARPGRVDVPGTQAGVENVVQAVGPDMQAVRPDVAQALGPDVVVEPDVNVRKSGRVKRRPQLLNDCLVGDEIDRAIEDLEDSVDVCCHISSVPKSYKEAVASPRANDWQEAMKTEMNALEENETFELTTLPPGRKPVGGRWVYALKFGPNNEEQCKARFVAKGYSQIPNVDYHETFAPTARHTSIRTLMQLAIDNDLVVHQMDVKAAYLNAPIDVELYVEQPEGFEVRGQNGEKLVYRLKKSLYGLKQSGRNWNNLLHSYLIEQGFSQSQVDPCVYTRNSSSEMIIVVIWVDDIIVAANSNSVLDNVKDSLKRKFRMKDFGCIAWFLGIEFEHGDGMISMSQKKYLEKVLEKFGMQNCKPKYSPCDVNVNKFCSESAEPVDSKLYREMIGSLIYVMTATRPDLCYIVSKLSQYMSNPTVNHLIAVKHVLRYIRATLDQKLVFRKSDRLLSLVGFCDADWASSEDRKSMTGYGFMLSEQGPLVSWKTRKQPIVALSTCEAEYMSISAATQEGIFLKALLSDMTGHCVEDFTLYCDNQGAVSLSKNPIVHQRSKHIDIRYHFVRDEIQKGSLKILYVPSEQNVSDVFTKSLPRDKSVKFRKILMGM